MAEQTSEKPVSEPRRPEPEEASSVNDPVASKLDSRRQRDRAETAMRELLRYFGAKKEAIDKVAASPREWSILFRYATDVILNIHWYDREIRKQRRLRAALAGLTVFVGLFLMSAPIWGGLALTKLGMAVSTNQGALGAQVGLVLSTVVAAWRLILTATDTSVRIGLFWQASSDLKELHFSLGDKWRGRFGDSIPSEFIADVDERLKKARDVTRSERAAFFGTFKSPGALIDTAIAGRDQVVKAREAMLNAWKAEAEAHANDRDSWTMEEAIRAHDAAVTAVRMKEETLAALKVRFGEKDHPSVAKATAAVADAIVASIEAKNILQRLQDHANAPSGGPAH
jgi:hypothetical protein